MESFVDYYAILQVSLTAFTATPFLQVSEIVPELASSTFLMTFIHSAHIVMPSTGVLPMRNTKNFRERLKPGAREMQKRSWMIGGRGTMRKQKRRDEERGVTRRQSKRHGSDKAAERT
jgi:hypothetical protein